ncbi:DUF4468 domain-containing protein [Elizabethkingia miricola]|uniref:DUF4468 domain-containing protein n=1 Tax=Elizabethkingia miricola TaxID=172045 RepID=A0ABD5B4M6_ELIMR|nr:DUF4468 domain-containing protein [Elizabethkingia miricola]MDQ8748336.1 DUF4468 domain-containing protein [Elizabethkingia miricola]
MNKLFTLLAIFIGSIITAQEFTLLPTGLHDKSDNSKDYIVFNIENRSKNELFNSVRKYLNTLYNNPENVMTVVDGEQIVVNALNSKSVKIKGSARFDTYYSMTYDFKDNKIKVSFFIKKFERPNYGRQDDIYNVVGFNLGFLGKTGIYDDKGKLLIPEAKESAENFVNTFVKSIISNATSQNNNDW